MPDNDPIASKSTKATIGAPVPQPQPADISSINEGRLANRIASKLLVPTGPWRFLQYRLDLHYPTTQLILGASGKIRSLSFAAGSQWKTASGAAQLIQLSDGARNMLFSLPVCAGADVTVPLFFSVAEAANLPFLNGINVTVGKSYAGADLFDANSFLDILLMYESIPIGQTR